MANKNPWQRTVTPEVTKQPLLEGKTFRVDIENWGIPRDATASDVVRFEETELGNKYDLSVSLLKELENYSHNDVVWVTKKSIDAEYYLSEGMTKKDISEVTLPKGSRIIAEDGQGGYLVLRGDAKPEVATPKAPAPEVTPTPPSTNFIATLLVIGLPLAILYLVLRRDDETA